ncbi:MAG: pyrroline-5-carboxylate reductase, partial [Candidatus Atribacteria bacterium]|nr:pyrroline-5-carboxylate reductase [Candidatus Atribacteria bacterium]
MKSPFLFAGCGNMGSALVRGLCRDKWHTKYEFILYDTIFEKAMNLEHQFCLRRVEKLNEVIEKPGVIFLAVKPYELSRLAEQLSAFPGSLFISMAAGVSVSQLQHLLGEEERIVRLMPNLCVEVGEGVLPVSFSETVSEEDKEDILFLFSTLGWVFEAQENEFDMLTAVSGSGPGLAAIFIEAMMDAGVKIGLPWEKSLKLVLQTVLGTAVLLKARNIHPGVLKNQVSSPGGT